MEKTDSFLAKLISDIENSDSYVMNKRSENDFFELTDDPSLTADLSGGQGAYFVRFMLSKLRINEHHVFRWRLENKYIQYQVINHYIPGAVAKTFSFSEILDTEDGINKIRELCESGFFIKSTLGDSSGRKKRFDRTAELNEIINSYQSAYNKEEIWMIQEKLDLNEEFRIHTFGMDVIAGLAFRINGSGSDGQGALEFVKVILEQLPDTILQGSLIGWDIGVTNDHQFYVIEGNFTGFHPVYGHGFQTSGYFQDARFGAIVCAWLNNFFKCKYKISVSSVETNLQNNSKFFSDVMFYSSVLTEEHLDILMNKKEIGDIPAMLYLGDNTNTRYITLLKYFQLVNLAPKFYMIISEECLPDFTGLIKGIEFIDVLAEQNLFTKDQYLSMKELSYEKRKKLCCARAGRLIEEAAYIML